MLGHGLVLGTNTFSFDFGKTRNDAKLENVINTSLRGQKGDFAVFVEELPASPSASLKNPRKYAVNEMKPFPAASLYKLVLMAAIEKQIEGGKMKREDTLVGDKEKLAKILGGEEFGYEKAPDQIKYSVDEALTRVGRISDNFAAIMLTNKLRESPEEGLLYQMTHELGMKNTDFAADPIKTTAEDVALFFKLLYQGKVVSLASSEKIIQYLSLSQLNNRIPSGVPEGVKVVHKTGELARTRHDAGIVYLEGSPYVIVLLSENLPFEDEGIKTLAQISKGVYEYFTSRGN